MSVTMACRPHAFVAALAATTLTAPGCYQSIGLGYAPRVAGEPTGHGAGGHWLFTGEEVVADHGGAGVVSKVEITAGPWGARFTDVLGVMLSDALSDGVLSFVRPGVALLVMGIDDDGREEPPLWVGLGAEVEGGLLVRAGGVWVEIGGRVGGDLGYTGLGTALHAGVFVSLGWVTELELDLVTD